MKMLSNQESRPTQSLQGSKGNKERGSESDYPAASLLHIKTSLIKFCSCTNEKLEFSALN